MSDYEHFVQRKLSSVMPTGIASGFSVPPTLFPHQSALTAWALRRGRAAIFADTGLGKSRMQLAWAEYPVDLWQKVASPVWMDINPSETLQYMSARDHDDERHIAPLQLEVIRRGVMLWTNPDDIVLSPFMGIGSEGYVSLEMGRRFVGIELKASYYRQAVANLAAATAKTEDLFAA